MMVTIKLPIVTPSPNKLLRMHFTERTRLRNEYGWLLVAAGAKDEQYQAGWKEWRQVEIMSFRKRLLDPDNLVGSMKILLDAMQEVGLLFDDSAKYLTLAVSQTITKDEPWTEIKIRTLEEKNE